MSVSAVATTGWAWFATTVAHIQTVWLAQELDISPTSAGLPGADLFKKIVNWLGQIGIWGTAAAFLIGAAMWAAGGLSSNPQMAARGQKAIAISIVAAMLLGGATVILKLFYGAGGGIS